ncbi:MAG: hypothetical protein Q7J34_07180 [Bacteroidales bacterium]|jgi:hypothetical protein|nr:hypothetical protein [Bacteroidales bacterium]
MSVFHRKLPLVALIIHRFAMVIGIIYAIFISIFAVDVFRPGMFLLEEIAQFFVQLIPGVMVIVLVIWSLFKPFHAGVVLILTGLLSIWFFSTNTKVLSFMLISFPIIFSGLLMIIAWFIGEITRKKPNIIP